MYRSVHSIENTSSDAISNAVLRAPLMTLVLNEPLPCILKTYILNMS